jgi:hypothetical protein
MYLWRGVIHILEFDPQATTQERLLDCLRRGTGQQHWNGAEFVVAFDGTIEDVTHLFALPRPVAIRPDKDHSAVAVLQRLYQRILDRLAGHEIPLIEKRILALFPEHDR